MARVSSVNYALPSTPFPSTNLRLCHRRKLNKQEEALVEDLIKPMKKVKTESEWNVLHSKGIDSLEKQDVDVVSYFNQKVQEARVKMEKTFAKNAPATQAEVEESPDEVAFREGL